MPFLIFVSLVVGLTSSVVSSVHVQPEQSHQGLVKPSLLSGPISAERVNNILSKLASGKEPTTEDSQAPLVSGAPRTQASGIGYVEIKTFPEFYATNQCKSPEYSVWFQYGTCIVSDGNTNAYMLTYTGPDANKAYTLIATEYSDPICSRASGTSTVTASIGDCTQDGAMLQGFQDTYEPKKGAINGYSYNTLTECESGDYSTVFEAYAIELGMCIDELSQSTKYDSCNAYTYYSDSTDCDQSGTWTKAITSYSPFDITTCELEDDDGDEYEAVSYTLMNCLDSGAAGVFASARNIGVLAVAAAALTAVTLL